MPTCFYVLENELPFKATRLTKVVYTLCRTAVTALNSTLGISPNKWFNFEEILPTTYHNKVHKNAFALLYHKYQYSYFASINQTSR